MKKHNYSRNEIFETLPVPKAVWAMIGPAIISQMIVMIYNLADTFFLGKTNNPYMVAGAALILPVFNISISFINLSGIGGGALISRLLGEHRPEEVSRVYAFCVRFSIIVACMFSLCTAVFMRPLLNVLGAGEQTFEYARNYAFCVIVLGAIPTILSNVLAMLIRSIGESRKASFGITMGGILNVFLDPLLMFVIMPDGMEIVGVGIATFISNCVACTYFILNIRSLENNPFKLQGSFRMPEKESLKAIFSVGIPSCISVLLYDLDYMVIDRLMSGYGDIPLAAMGIVLKAERLPQNICLAICQGMLPVVAYNYASKNISRMDEVKKFALRAGLVCSACSIVLYLSFAQPVIRIFIEDSATIELGSVFLRLRCLATPLMFLCLLHVHLFNGFGCGKEAMLLTSLRWGLFNIPVLFIMNRFYGMNGIAFSQFIGDVFPLVISIIVYRRFKQRKLTKIIS